MIQMEKDQKQQKHSYCEGKQGITSKAFQTDCVYGPILNSTFHVFQKGWFEDSDKGLVHDGGEMEFIPNALLLWKAKTMSGDYHDQIFLRTI